MGMIITDEPFCNALNLMNRSAALIVMPVIGDLRNIGPSTLGQDRFTW
jgi:hypothetical protein